MLKTTDDPSKQVQKYAYWLHPVKYDHAVVQHTGGETTAKTLPQSKLFSRTKSGTMDKLREKVQFKDAYVEYKESVVGETADPLHDVPRNLEQVQNIKAIEAETTRITKDKKKHYHNTCIHPRVHLVCSTSKPGGC